MDPKLLRNLGLCLAVLGALVLVGDGCIFSPDSTHKPPPGGGPQPVVQSTPENTLKQLEYVYSNRDSLLIKDVYDSTYVGTSTDQTAGNGGQILNFSYPDEIDHVAAMARAHEITTVTLSFGALTRLPSDDISHPDWALVQISGANMRLEVDASVDSLSARLNPVGETFKFKLKPVTPASTPTDTLWKIVRWEEIYVGGA